MPNIELHGYFERPGALELKIFDLFKDKPYVDEMVVTCCNDHVHDAKGNNQPFIRLVNSCQEHTEEIIEVLKTLHIDIEHLKLEAFIPKVQKNESECRMHGSIEHMQSTTGLCPECGKP